MRIRVPEVRCIGPDGEQIGVISTREALMRAQQAGLDLIEIAPNAQPPVCRITDYGKFKYDLEKKEKQSRKHQAATRVKEIQFHPNVGDHDYQTKLRHLRDFLQHGFRIKVSLYFRGREGAHQEIGFEVMQRVIRDASDLGHAEQPPRLFGRNILMLLCPRPRTKGAGAEAAAPRPVAAASASAAGAP